MSDNKQQDLGFIGLLKSFPRPFWVASAMELFERWAWYGLFAVLALYLTGSTDEGALGFNHIQKGEIMSYVTFILYLLPIITGAIADKIGYKKSLIIAYTLLGTGYYFMGQVTSYTAVFLVFLWVAVGAAMFKPVASAIVTKSTDKRNSSFGFGVFYMMVNIGGFFGPLFSAKLRDQFGWKIVFIMAASAIAVNMLLVLFVFKEPNREESKESFGQMINKSVKNIIEALSDMKLTLLLLIMVGFWLMFNQLFYTLPTFIEDWVNTKPLGEFLDKAALVPQFFADFFKNKEGGVNPEMIVNLDAFFIVVFQMLISTIILKWKPINAMMSGIMIAIIGIALSFYTNNVFYTIFGIFIFAIGEMTSNPKFSDYIAKISPKGKEALYMGTYFLPIALANLLTKWITGDLYEKYSDKVSLLERALAEKGIQLPEVGSPLTKQEFIDKLHTLQAINVEEVLKFIPPEEHIENWKPVVTQIKEYAKQHGIENLPLSGEFSKNDLIHRAAEALHMTPDQLTQYLWDTYHPGQIWYIIAGIGLITIVGLVIYDRVVAARAKKNLTA
ncbi:MAG TPA: MFS transporter [Flavobacteriales bacterium]|nr:MFS transporter [Flavobacteriales bacterium]